MTWIDYPMSSLTWTGPGGEPKWYKTWPTTSRGFCPDCGSSIAGFDDGGDRMGVTIMSLDDPTGIVPIHQSFANNAATWQKPIESKLEN